MFPVYEFREVASIKQKNPNWKNEIKKRNCRQNSQLVVAFILDSFQFVRICLPQSSPTLIWFACKEKKTHFRLWNSHSHWRHRHTTWPEQTPFCLRDSDRNDCDNSGRKSINRNWDGKENKKKISLITREEFGKNFRSSQPAKVCQGRRNSSASWWSTPRGNEREIRVKISLF